MRCLRWFLVFLSFLMQGVHAQLGPVSSKLTKEDVFNAFPGGVANAQTKNNMPVACKQGASQSWVSFIKTASPTINHPKGQALFADDAQLGTLLTQFLTNLEADATSRYFTVYLTKIHFIVLHEIYLYLTKIYTTFNMTHIDQLNDYLTLDAQQALNKKTLIINHLINIVESQLNGAMIARFPTLPPHLATYAGGVLMKHDYGAEISVMLKQAEQSLLSDPEVQQMVSPNIAQLRDSYLSLFGDYLRFFNRYTETLNHNDTSQGYKGVTIFAQHAQRIAQLMAQVTPTVNPAFNTQEKINWLRSINTLNPPLFFYNADTMRGLKIIPALAQSLPSNVVSVPWPQQIVAAANSGQYIKPKFGPETTTKLAYFESNRLYVNIPTMQYMYTQELLPQPAWLNSTKGVMLMLQACLGDFSRILDPLFAQEDILDPCIECIVRNAAQQAGIVATIDQVTCDVCTAFINGIKTKIDQEAQSQLPPLNVPDDGSGLTVPDEGVGS